MNIYEIQYPTLEMTIKFKMLATDTAVKLAEKRDSIPRIDYILTVLNSCVMNLRTSVHVALRKLSTVAADEILMSFYNGCVMINPVLDPDTWMDLTYSYNLFHTNSNLSSQDSSVTSPPPPASLEKISEVDTKSFAEEKKKEKDDILRLNARFAGLELALNSKVIGQYEAIEKISKALKRAHVGLSDANRPLGVFLFAGPSGVGKTLIAKELQKYLYGNADLVRIDCGEYQHKHENQKLIGSPPGFVGHDEGGQLTKAIANNTHTVLLLDEAEKAHPDFWNTFLKVFDEGSIRDSKGKNISFKDVVIVITSNLGNDKITKTTFSRGTGFNADVNNQFKSKKIPEREYVERETLEAIHKFFKPEMLNRLDEIVVFNHLQPEDYSKIAELEMRGLSVKMLALDLDIRWDESVTKLLADKSGASIEGARGMAKIRREEIENPLADILLKRRSTKPRTFTVVAEDNEFKIR